MSKTFRSTRAAALAAALGAAGAPLHGCGEAAPPPVSMENFAAGKKDREVIIQKEYGQAAFEKGQAAGKARAK
jgi:hypothetical protein